METTLERPLFFKHFVPNLNKMNIADINQTLNGPKDEGLSGLSALAVAIANSTKPNVTTPEPDVFNQEGGED